MRGAARNRAAREAVESLQVDLRSSREDSIIVTPLASGNHQVVLQTFFEVAGSTVWGAEYEDPGAIPTLQSVADWSVRYTVAETVIAGALQRALVREVIDDVGVVRHAETIATGIGAGGGEPPGFAVDQVGGVWRVMLSLDGWTTGTSERTVELHVATRM